MQITIAGGKGGTGKTFISTALSFICSKQLRTILVDVDVECPNDHLIFGIDRVWEKEICHSIPKINSEKCIKCGKCADVCRQNSLVFIKDKIPAFVKDTCIGCMACKLVCPVNAISEDKKIIGNIYSGKYENLYLISGELLIGELASGEVVIDVKKYAKKESSNIKANMIFIDAPAGTGCPVIASLVDSDYIILVTEPTPSALHDMKRVLYLAQHFKIPCGIIINKYDLIESFCLKIKEFAKECNIPIIGKIPYKKEFLDSSLKMKIFVELYPEYADIIYDIINKKIL